MTRRTRSVPFAIAALLLVGGGGCARSAPPPSETPARVKDSAPEKIAAQRAAIPGLNLEQDDQRWGVEATRDRKRAAPPEPPATTDASKPRPADVRKPK